jgi:DNA-binding FadR family transcriptional regulator
MALQGALLQEVVAMHYEATIGDKHAENNRPERFTRVLASFRKLAKLVDAGDSDGARGHWLRHMRTAARTLLGDDVKNRPIVDLFR